VARNRWGIVGVFAFVTAITVALVYLWQSQLVAPSGAATGTFSATRAIATLSSLLKEQRPHPVGSPENAIVRDRIVAELKAAGYAPEVQPALQCDPTGGNAGCTAIENIIAVHRGTGSGKAVLVSAHYDSVPGGPGVSDDGAGVAVVVELARIYSGKPTGNDIIFLITDGEETGLRGAHAFAERHPLMSRIGVVVNFEARGASGPAMMFETGPGNAGLLGVYARSVARPSANSVTYEVYRLLPNDTDFTVYRKSGLTGFNFAFSNSASLYHSARDDLQNIDPRSLRHMGDQALAVVGVLADADLDRLKSETNASFFDVFGWFTVMWPAALNVPIAIVAVAAILALFGLHRDAFHWRAAGWAGAAFVAVPLLLFGVGWLLSYPLGIWPGVHPLDHPQPWPGRVAVITAGLLVPLIVAALVRRRVDARVLFLVNWIVLALRAVAAAIKVTGAAYPLLWPAFGVAVAAWIETLLRKSPARSLRVSGLIGFVLVAFLWLWLVLGLEMVLGFDLTQFRILTLIPFSLSLVPVFAASTDPRFRSTWVLASLCAVVVAGAAAVGSRTPAFAADHPRGLNIIYYDDRANQPRWQVGFVGPPDEAFLAAHGFPARDEEYPQFGLLRSRGRFKVAAEQSLAAPSFDVKDVTTRDGTTVMRGVLRSGRGGFLLGVGAAPGSGIRAIRVDGQEAIGAAQLQSKDPALVRLWGMGSRDVPMEVAFAADAPPKLVLFERSHLPDSEEGRSLKSARPADAAPAYSGDSAIVVVTTDLKP